MHDRSLIYLPISYRTASVILYIGEDTNVVIPNEINGLIVTKIEAGAFFDQKDIISVTIPSTVNEIGIGAFGECCNLTNLVIPETVEKIEESAFWGCTGLADENGFVIINNIMFGYLGHDETVAVPDGIRTIGFCCFCHNNINNLKNIKSVILPDSVQKIGELAFGGCINLQKVEIPNVECEIDEDAFGGCSVIIHTGEWNYTIHGDNTAVVTGYTGNDTKIVVPDEICGLLVTEISQGAFRGKHNIISVALPDTIRKIGDFAFEDCYNLTHINIPENIKTIGMGAFADCDSLADENGFAIIQNVLCGYLGSSEIVTVPHGIATIGYQCFRDNAKGNAKLKEIILPDSVCKIDDQAFLRCPELRKVGIQGTLKEIGIRAFEGCYNLKDIVIPETVEKIGYGTFHDCDCIADENGFMIFNKV